MYGLIKYNKKGGRKYLSPFYYYYLIKLIRSSTIELNR